MCHFSAFILGFSACDALMKLTPFQGKYCCQMDAYQSKHQLAPFFGKHESCFFMVRTELQENGCISCPTPTKYLITKKTENPLSVLRYMKGDDTVREEVHFCCLSLMLTRNGSILTPSTQCTLPCVKSLWGDLGCLCSLFRVCVFFIS